MTWYWTLALGVGEGLLVWWLLWITWWKDLGDMPGDRGE